MLNYLSLQASNQDPTLLLVIFSLMTSFILSVLIAFVYEKTFQGLSYSRNFVQALIMCSIVANIAMQAIGDNLARGLGLVGALTIIRFRTNLKDTRDMIFIFASLTIGLASGVNSYLIAVIGTLVFCATAFLLSKTSFGHDRSFDGMLRFNVENKSESRKSIEKVMIKYCSNFAMISIRDIAQGKRMDYSYHVRLKNSYDQSFFIADLNKVSTINGVNLLVNETNTDI
jgi:uncharacterized membrane protein YhiD involved in acid resistance